MPRDLPPLPPQRDDAPWPTGAWATAPPDPDVDRDRAEAVLARVFAEPVPEATGETHALVVAHRGRLVFERYDAEHDASTPCISWSMAKSILHAAVGILVGEGRLDPAAPAPVAPWRAAGDPRGAITLEHLLRMVDGLDFIEDYTLADVSSVIDMLFGAGKADVAGYAASSPRRHEPGSCWSYSSGTSNVVAAIAGDAVGGGRDGMASFLRDSLFEPIGMRTATPRFDEAGHWIGSSFVFATARDFARFGLLYLRDGVWDGQRILPPGWVDHGRRPTPASGGEYGAHWWLALDGSGRFSANGFRGQYTLVDPARDLVVVRLGNSTDEQRVEVVHGLREIVESFPLRSGL